MATIKIRRGSGQPAIGGSGLTAYEPAWDTVNNRFFINNGSTAMWIGAAVIQDTTLSGNCTWTIPTQNSVKTYVDNQVAAGAVTSVNGATGAVTIGGGTGISILTSAAARGVTIFNAGVLSINGNTGAISNVAFTNVAQTFTQLQAFSSGLSATTGIFTGAITANAGISASGLSTGFIDATSRGGLTFNCGGNTATFINVPTLDITSNILTGDASGIIRLRTSSDNGFVRLTPGGSNKTNSFNFSNSDGTVLAVSNATPTGGATTGWIPRGNGTGLPLVFIDPTVSGFSAFQSDRTDRLFVGDAPGGTLFFDFSGGKTGYQLHYTSNNVTWNETGSRLTAPNIVATSGITTGNLTFTGTILGNVVTSVNGVTGAVTNVASLNGATGAVTVGAGTGISIATSTAARGITVTNVGVTGLTGTANQITVSGTTGSITLTLPSAITAPGSLTTTTSLLVGTDATISGNLTVNGTTTTVNSTTVTVQDPIIAIGGITGNAPPPNGDTKDRGIVFQWNNGSTGQTGFFGFDRSTQRFSYFPSGVTLSGEIITPPPAAGSAEFAGVYAPQGFLTLEGTCAASATISLSGGTGVNSTILSYTGKRHMFANGALAGDDPQIELYSAGNQAPNVATIITSTAGSITNSNKTLTLPDWSGGAIVAATSGATSGFILRGIGATSRPDWFNPNTSGFTAFTTTNINLVGVKDASNYGLVFALGTAGNNILYGDSTTGVMWRPSTNTLTVGAGVGFFEGIIEGGTF